MLKQEQLEKSFKSYSCGYHSKMVNSSGVVYLGKAEIAGITIIGNGAAAVVDIHDGENTKMEKRYRLVTADGTSFSVPFLKVDDFDYGIYVTVNAATTFVMIQYLPVSKEQVI